MQAYKVRFLSSPAQSCFNDAMRYAMQYPTIKQIEFSPTMYTYESDLTVSLDSLVVLHNTTNNNFYIGKVEECASPEEVRSEASHRIVACFVLGETFQKAKRKARRKRLMDYMEKRYAELSKMKSFETAAKQDEEMKIALEEFKALSGYDNE